MMHAVIYLEEQIDKDKFRQAISIMLSKVPVLRSVYVASKVKPYWEVQIGDFTDAALSFSETKDLDKDLDEFITGRFQSDSAPQFRVKVFTADNQDTIAMLVNHQCFDGADFKQFIYKVAEIYNDIINGGTGESVPVKSGTRANSQVYGSMTPEDSKIAKGMFKNVSKTKHMIAFPFTEDMDHNKAMMVKHKLSAGDFEKLKEYGKTYNSTINDVLLAAYFRALYHLVNLNENECITIPCMTDLRKHIESGETAGFTNLTCLIPCTIDSVGPEFSATLKKVHGEMEKWKKDKFAGLGGIPLLELAYKIAPSSIAELMIKIGYTNPYIGMSNIGIIDEKKIEFGKAKPRDAFMTGAIKYKPYMQVALTTFKKAITFTICIYGNQSDRAIIEKFFRLFDAELKSVIN
jgi:NRPS condensation-like uncharacterized protein